MKEFVVWVAGVEAVGLVAFPLAFAFFSRLPDRGYAFAKVIGLLLLGYGLWIGSVSGLVPNERGTVYALLLGLACVSLLSAAPRRQELRDYVRSGWRYMVLIEGMFLAVLAGAVFLRSFAPNIESGEKPFELAFLNAVNRAESFPPEDPWLSGHNISYYYFGYVIAAALTKLTALETSVTFFLSLSLMAALTWTAVFGLVYNLVLAARGADASVGPSIHLRGIVFGLVGAMLVLVASNWEGGLELMARHGIGSGNLYERVGVYGLPGPYDCEAAPFDCAEWYPTQPWWWLRATQMGSPGDIQEFPFSSLHVGDLHANVLVMPLLVVLLAVCLQTLRTGVSSLFRPRRFALAVLLVGGIAFTDLWALPLAVALIGASAVAACWLSGEHLSLARLARAFGVPAAVVVAGVAVYLPFYLDFEASSGGIDAIRAAATAEAPPANSEVTRPLHFLMFWGPLFWPFACLILVSLGRPAGGASRPVHLIAAAAALSPLLVWAAFVLHAGGFDGLRDEIGERNGNMVTVLLLCTIVVVAGAAFVRSFRFADEGRGAADTFALLVGFVAAVMLLGAELFFVDDAFGWRANTVFRFWHQGWLVLAVVGAWGLYRVTEKWNVRAVPGVVWRSGLVAVCGGLVYSVVVALDPAEELYSRWWTATGGLLVAGAVALALAVAGAMRGGSLRVAAFRLPVLAVTAVVLTCAFVYPVLVVFERTGGFRNDQTVDGLYFVRQANPDEYEAIQWLNDNASGSPVILEGFGDDFSEAGRVSSRTGLPTVLGWVGHEIEWRGVPEPTADFLGEPPFVFREDVIGLAYLTPDPAEAEAILRAYRVEYVFLGELERTTYSQSGFTKFSRFMELAYRNGTVTIYRMPETPVLLGSARGQP